MFLDAQFDLDSNFKDCATSLTPLLRSGSMHFDAKSPNEPRFTPYVIRHRAKIVPLLGDSKFARALNDEGKTVVSETFLYERLICQPMKIRASLKPHQIEGVSFLLYLRRNKAHGILGDEMGLGKTLQVLSFFQHVINTETDDTRPFLVVCPLSVLTSWKSEIQRWTCLISAIYYGSVEERQLIGQMVRSREVDIIITTYETVVADIHRLTRLAVWRCVVLDEAHRVKNVATKLFGSVSKLKTQQRIVVTGTPVQNNLSEIWSIFNFLYPAVFGKETKEFFEDAFSLANGHVDLEFLEDVKNFLKIIMLRRTKEAPNLGLELPQKTEVVMYLPLAELQKRLYLEVLTGVGKSVNTAVDDNIGCIPATPPPSPGVDRDTSRYIDQIPPNESPRRSISHVLMTLRKLCIHPWLVDGDCFGEDTETDISEFVKTSAKFIVLKRLLDQEVIKMDRKMLIFSGFDQALDCCTMLLEAMDIEYLRLDGKTCYAMREYNIHRFQKQNQYKVFVIATKAGGEGLTLTAAEIVVFLDEDWNPQTTLQAEARAYRIGQTMPVTIYKLCTRGTVEQQMLSRVNKKLYLASKIMDNFSNMASSDTAATIPVESDSAFLKKLIRGSSKTMKIDNFDAESLLTMDWDTLLKFCMEAHDAEHDMQFSFPPQMPPTPGRESFHEEEKAWLANSERVLTRLFNGKIFKRPLARLKDSEIAIDLDPASRRINKNTVVYDERIDYYISKESILCKDGEAVPPSTNNNKTPSKSNKKVKVEWDHVQACIVCGKARRVIKCTVCPQVYHEECVARSTASEAKKVNPFGNNLCPQHRCVICDSTAHSVGGLILSCTTCPNSYCIDCINLSAIKGVDAEQTQFPALGYEKPKHIEYIKCSDCCVDGIRGDLKRSAEGDCDHVRKRDWEHRHE